MSGGETVKELYGRGKRHSVRGIASDFSVSRATVSQVRAIAGGAEASRPDRKRGSKLDAYKKYIDVRVSEGQENCVVLVVDKFGI